VELSRLSDGMLDGHCVPEPITDSLTVDWMTDRKGIWPVTSNLKVLLWKIIGGCVSE